MTDYTLSPALVDRSFVRAAPDERIEALEAALRRITASPAGTAPPVVELAHRALADLAGIRIHGRLATISGRVAHDFRLDVCDLQSTCREQRIAFVRQLAMFLCRKITGAPFESIGEHFHREHSTVIHACRTIELRLRRDAAFRLLLEKLEGRITGTILKTPVTV
jgi:chromosomal replication initiator protein